jgi:putative phage-type endonuclease
VNPQHALVRAHRIGSSDAAKILGLSKWGTAHDVYLRLTDRLESEDVETPAMLLGKMMESPLIDKAAQELGWKVRRNVIRALGNLSAQLDAKAIDHDSGIEAKTAGSMEDWGENGTDNIPAHYAAQVVHQASVAGMDFVAVPVFFVGLHREFRLYLCKITPEQKEKYIEFMEGWFDRHIKGDTPPPVAPSLDVAKLIKRVDGKIVSATDSQVQLWARRKVMASAMTKIKNAKEELESVLLSSMGDAQAIEHDGKLLRVLTVNRKAYSVEAGSYKQLKEVKV